MKSVIRFEWKYLNGSCVPTDYFISIDHIVYYYLNSNFAVWKNLKKFTIRVKELFEPIVLLTIGDGVFVFLKAFFEIIFCQLR